MPQTETHTPTDWHIDPASDGETIAIRDPVANMYAIIQIDLHSEIGGQTDAKVESMAKTILTAVNSHAALVEACRSAQACIANNTPMVDSDDPMVAAAIREAADDMDAVREQLRKALAQAEAHQ